MKTSERWGWCLVIGGGLMMVTAWIGVSAAIFRAVSGW
jgi:hypothetical protein